MGYNTDFSGTLYFKNELTIRQFKELEKFMGADCREHPEWGNTDISYIDLQINNDYTGIEWDGSEKTYELVLKINLIISNMQKQFPGFELEGELLAQGEDINDRYLITIENNVAVIKYLEQHRYSLFGGLSYYPNGGMNDLIVSSNSLNELLNNPILKQHNKATDIDWWHISDNTTNKIIRWSDTLPHKSER